MTRSTLALLPALLLFAMPLCAQDSPLFPHFSLTAGTSATTFETNARIDPNDGTRSGTLVNFESDLGLDDAQNLPRLRVQWRPFDRHELEGTWFSASRDGAQNIDRTIVFQDETYPVQAFVTTALDLDYMSAAYTYWMRRSERDGVGISLGLASIAIDATIEATGPGVTRAVIEHVDTDVPVALAGLQGRIAFTDHLHGEASLAMLPRVTIEDYTGSALTGSARVEYRPVRWLGVGAAYDYFRLDVDVAQTELRGEFDMTVRGPSVYLRLSY
jgi:hypothetical protein